MKKIIFLILFSIGLAVSTSPISLVTKVKGSVKYRKNSNKDKLVNIKSSNALFNQDQIVTGEDGFTKFVYLDDGTTIKIHKNSEVFVQGNPKKRSIVKQINISEGIINLNVSKQFESEFNIITPTSVATVKGTDFWIICDPDKGDKFLGVSGNVKIKNKETGEQIELTKDTKVESKPDGTLASMPLPKSDYNQVNKLEIEVGEGSIQDRQNTDSSYNQASPIESPQESGDNTIELIIRDSNGNEKIIILSY
jgi:hypothetical protein